MPDLTTLKLPRLRQVVEGLHPAVDGSGLCFHRAAALVLDMRWAFLCIGTLRAASEQEAELNPRYSPVPFLHAWVEQGPVVWAPSLLEAHGGELLPIDRDAYYTANDARDIYRMGRAELVKLDRQHGWSRRLVFGRRKTGELSLGAVLLEALGVPHVVVDGAVLPSPGQHQEIGDE
jgi:hypothetical protein